MKLVHLTAVLAAYLTNSVYKPSTLHNEEFKEASLSILEGLCIIAFGPMPRTFEIDQLAPMKFCV